MNYLREIRIDETALDVEWFEQAELAIKWGKYWSECQDEVDRAEENIKVIRSELILKINKNPDFYLGKGIKPTDAKVEAAFRVHKRHKEAKERWLTALKIARDAEIVKNEFSFTRKAALENLVTLHGQNYFAGPSIPRNITEERTKRKERIKKIKIIEKQK